MKPIEYLKLNGKTVRHNGSVFKIIAVTLFGRPLVDAECLVGPEKGTKINVLSSRSNLCKDIRRCCEMGLVS